MGLLLYIIRKRKWRLWPCLWPFRRHIFDWTEWSRSFDKPSIANFHCRRCQKIIKRLPFDDVPEEYRNYIFYIADSIKEVED